MTTVCCISNLGMDQSILDAVTEDSAFHLISDRLHTSYTPDDIKLIRPDILLFAIDGINQSEIINTIHTTKTTHPETKIIIITSSTEETWALQLLETGIDSLVDKPTAITETIHSVMNGCTIVPHHLFQSFISRFMTMKTGALNLFTKRLLQNGLELTNKEIEVAYFIRRGLGNKEIAYKLQINEGAVKAHVSHIYKKTECKKRHELQTTLDRIFPVG